MFNTFQKHSADSKLSTNTYLMSVAANIGKTCNIGKYQTAIEYYQKAQECGDKRQTGEAYLGLGNAYLEIGQYQTVIEYCQKAEKVALECYVETKGKKEKLTCG